MIYRTVGRVGLRGLGDDATPEDNFVTQFLAEKNQPAIDAANATKELHTFAALSLGSIAVSAGAAYLVYEHSHSHRGWKAVGAFAAAGFIFPLIAGLFIKAK